MEVDRPRSEHGSGSPEVNMEVDPPKVNTEVAPPEVDAEEVVEEDQLRSTAGQVSAP